MEFRKDARNAALKLLFTAGVVFALTHLESWPRFMEPRGMAAIAVLLGLAGFSTFLSGTGTAFKIITRKQEASLLDVLTVSFALALAVWFLFMAVIGLLGV